jgi:heptaprenylglyceryl phosphate synthase
MRCHMHVPSEVSRRGGGAVAVIPGHVSSLLVKVDGIAIMSLLFACNVTWCTHVH